MNKMCSRCDKIVYPTEELKCLDKVWHKICFKCKECGMSLTMRNYKGYNKEPYCEAHIPKAKATTMAETPELRRIAENTKLQSNVKYHADFEKSKGKFTQVADDPEMMRIKQNSKIISNVAYHGDLAKKAVMEKNRTINDNQNGFKEIPTHMQQQNHHQHHGQDKANANIAPPIAVAPPPMMTQPPPQQQQAMMSSHQDTHVQMRHAHMNQAAIGNPQNIGKISDYEPQVNSPYTASRNSQTLIYSSDQGAVQNPPSRHIGSVHDIDPVNHNYGSLGRVYKAMYDYEAQDDDEVSFQDGDLIINVSSIDGGWMTGEVQRTGQAGMLPANYVQVARI